MAFSSHTTTATTPSGPLPLQGFFNCLVSIRLRVMVGASGRTALSSDILCFRKEWASHSGFETRTVLAIEEDKYNSSASPRLGTVDEENRDPAVQNKYCTTHEETEGTTRIMVRELPSYLHVFVWCPEFHRGGFVFSTLRTPVVDTCTSNNTVLAWKVPAR
jgi:hypothetical protein